MTNYFHSTMSGAAGAVYSRGLSLVELMIALVISMVLLLGVSMLYLDSRKTDKLAEALARIQETGRLAMDVMANDLRMAGYQGCMKSGEAVNILANSVSTTNLSATALRGFEVTASTWASGTEFDNTAIETDSLVGSDVIAVQRATSLEAELAANVAGLTGAVTVSSNPMGLGANSIAIIASCDNADLFRVSAAATVAATGITTLQHAASHNSSAAFIAPYKNSATETVKVMGFSSTAYFVADTGRNDAQGNAINALYRQTDNFTSPVSFTIEELVEGVDSLQILYGELLANGNIRYVPAGTAGLNWSQVVSIKVGLLISSSGDVQDAVDNLSYDLPGQTIATDDTTVTHPADRRLRRDFSMTIDIRNR
jgi:type IV pilus assembly protein PilW